MCVFLLFIMPLMNRSLTQQSLRTRTLPVQLKSLDPGSTKSYSTVRTSSTVFLVLFCFLRTHTYMYASCMGEQRYSQLGGWDGRRRPGHSRGRRHEGRGGRRQPEQDAGDLTRPTPRIASPPTTMTTTTCCYFRRLVHEHVDRWRKRMQPPMRHLVPLHVANLKVGYNGSGT